MKELEEKLKSERQSRKKEAAWLAKKGEISEMSVARKKEAAKALRSRTERLRAWRKSPSMMM